MRTWETYEYGPVPELLASLLATLQNALRGEGQPTAKAIAPRTGLDILDEEVGQAIFEDIMSARVSMTDEEYLAWSAANN